MYLHCYYSLFEHFELLFLSSTQFGGSSHCLNFKEFLDTAPLISNLLQVRFCPWINFSINLKVQLVVRSFGSRYARFSDLCCFGEVAVVKFCEDVVVANMQLSSLCFLLLGLVWSKIAKKKIIKATKGQILVFFSFRWPR